MRRQMFSAKIHRAVITQANLEYEGSITVDLDLMDAAGILPYEAVHLWNVTRGSRLMTYALPGERRSGVICVNGAAAHLNEPGDIIIIATFVDMNDDEARAHVPTVVRVDRENRIVSTKAETPGPPNPRSLGARRPATA